MFDLVLNTPCIYYLEIVRRNNLALIIYLGVFYLISCLPEDLILFED